MHFVDGGHSSRDNRPPKTTPNPPDKVKKSQMASLNKALLEKKTMEDHVVILDKSLGRPKLLGMKLLLLSNQ